MRVTKLKPFVVGAAVSIFTLSSHAIPLDYKIGANSSVQAHESGSGLEIETALASGLSGHTFTLNDGQSTTFNFFSIWTDETTVNWDDKQPRLITATLDFDVPDLNASVKGVTLSGTYYGWEAGGVIWNDPVYINAGNRIFSVNLNNAAFDWGNGGLGNHPAMITATVKQYKSSGTPPPMSVPEGGSTLVLLGIGMAGAALTRKALRK